jgi:hypothetical protein
MPDFSPEMVLIVGAVLLLISVAVLTCAIIWHRRRMEKWRKMDHLTSVYNQRERRLRGQ